MKDSTVSLNFNLARIALSAMLAIGTLTAFAGRAHAYELDPITLSPPVVKNVTRDEAGVPEEIVTVKASIAADTETLRNKSGVVFLHDQVLEAAHKACLAADPFDWADNDCMEEAVRAAAPQVKAAIAHARATAQ